MMPYMYSVRQVNQLKWVKVDIDYNFDFQTTYDLMRKNCCHVPFATKKKKIH